jgi:Glycosyl hydrolases family 15
VITDSSRVPLARRAWIGDGTRGALVSADGTIDWYCPDRLADPPALWRLLDPAGAAVRVGPVREASFATRRLPPSSQSYRPGTNVAETVMEGQGGRRVSVTDCLAWPGPGLSGDGLIVRLVRALAGPVEVEVEVLPAGRLVPARDVSASASNIVFDDLEVRCGSPFSPAPLGREEQRWRARVRLDAGEETVVTIGPAGSPGPATTDSARRLIEDTEKSWRSWLSALLYDGPFRDRVERSLLAVRSLTDLPGAPLAAGTTSLPRRVGNERTADDRWVRIRDAATAARVLAIAGFVEDAEAAEGWLRQAVQELPRPWPAWLDSSAQPVPEREELSLAGWRRTQPVVIGRPNPVDLGVYGAVVDAAGASMLGPGGRRGDPGPLSAAWEALSAAADYVCDHWREPDAGPWELEPPAGLNVASRLSIWSGLDRMVRMARAANPLDLDAVVWQQEGRAVLSWLEADGLAPDGGLRMDGRPGAGDGPDAGLVEVAWRGPWPQGHPIVGATVDRVLERLGSGPYVYRVEDASDNPDVLATLLVVKALCRLGRWEDAHERMDAVCRLSVAAPAIDPLSGEVLGNLPCTAVALALVDAAFAISGGPR